MRYLPFLILAAGLTACSHPAGHDQELQARIDSLEQQLDQATGHGFNVIETPENPPFTNQDFSVHKVN